MGATSPTLSPKKNFFLHGLFAASVTFSASARLVFFSFLVWSHVKAMNQLFFDDGRDCFSNNSGYSPLFAFLSFRCCCTFTKVDSLVGCRAPCGDNFGNPCFPVYPPGAVPVPVPIPLQTYSNSQECVAQPIAAVPAAVHSKMPPLHKRKPRPPRKQQSESMYLCCCPLHFVIHRCRE